jgi:T-complex protein 1 subunit gamma
LDSSLEYKKMESQGTIDIKSESDFEAVLKMEEEYVEKMCKDIIKHKPTLVFTEKGCSDLAQHFLMKAGISVIRRLRKTDNNRIARVCGATIVSRTDEIQETDIGTQCGLFEIRKIGDEYFTFLVDCENPKACTIMLRGASKDVLTEIERNLMDAMSVARNIVFDNRILPGGGAVEMAVATHLLKESKAMDGQEQWPFRAIAEALEVIPRTLIENCGGSTIRLLTDLRAKHAAHKGPTCCTLGIDGNKGIVTDMKAEPKIWEPYLVKAQTLKTAIEATCMLLRIDDVVSGISHGKKPGAGGPGPAAGGGEDAETMGDAQDG